MDDQFRLKKEVPFSPKGSPVKFDKKFKVYSSWNPDAKVWSWLFGEAFPRKDEWIERITIEVIE